MTASSWLAGRSASARTRLIAAGLWGMVAAAVALSFAAFARPTPRAEAAPVPPAPTVAPEGVAEAFVTAWLRAGEGTEATLLRYYPVPLDLRGYPPRPDLAVSTATVSAEEAGPDYWSVTVAADTGEGAHFYTVAIQRRSGLFAATSLPAEVAAPLGLARSASLGVGNMDRPSLDDPVAAAVSRFLSAMLAGDGELARYIAPHAPIRAVVPAPYARVELRSIATRNLPGTPRSAEVVAEVVATTATSRVSVLSYPLRLAVRVGRWEVTDILPAPTLATTQPSELATTTVAPVETTTTTSLPNTTTTGRPATATTTTRPLGR